MVHLLRLRARVRDRRRQRDRHRHFRLEPRRKTGARVATGDADRDAELDFRHSAPQSGLSFFNFYF